MNGVQPSIEAPAIGRIACGFVRAAMEISAAISTVERG